MRLAPLFSATALALVATTAIAQRSAPPPGNSLSGLADTLNGLSDDNSGNQAASAANTQEPVVAEAAVAASAETQPSPPPAPPGR